MNFCCEGETNTATIMVTDYRAHTWLPDSFSADALVHQPWRFGGTGALLNAYTASQAHCTFRLLLPQASRCPWGLATIYRLLGPLRIRKPGLLSYKPPRIRFLTLDCDRLAPPVEAAEIFVIRQMATL